MKKIFASAMIFAVGFASAQTVAYKGAGDVKVNLGANLQDGGTGIVSSVDYGLGESFSIGAQAGYLLGVKEIGGEIPKCRPRKRLFDFTKSWWSWIKLNKSFLCTPFRSLVESFCRKTRCRTCTQNRTNE